MKYFLLIILTISIYIFYLSQTNIFFMHLFEVNKVKEMGKPIVLKDIKKIEDINGTHLISCKYNGYNYEVGIGFKYEYLPTSNHKINPKRRDEYIIKTKIVVKNKDGEVVYIKNSDKVRGYGGNFSLEYYAMLPLESFYLKKCKDCTLEIDFIESDIKNVPKDLMYLYMRVDTSL